MYANSINIEEDIETLRDMVQSIDLNLKSNYQSLLNNAGDFKIQLEILTNDLFDVECKIKFLLSTVSSQEDKESVLALLETLVPIQRQIQVFGHIFSLKKINRPCP